MGAVCVAVSIVISQRIVETAEYLLMFSSQTLRLRGLCQRDWRLLAVAYHLVEDEL